jgi:hypothetical protein
VIFPVHDSRLRAAAVARLLVVGRVIGVLGTRYDILLQIQIIEQFKIGIQVLVLVEGL